MDQGGGGGEGSTQTNIVRLKINLNTGNWRRPLTSYLTEVYFLVDFSLVQVVEKKLVSEARGLNVVVKVTAVESPRCRLCSEYDRRHVVEEKTWTGHTVIHNHCRASPWHLLVKVEGVAEDVEKIAARTKVLVLRTENKNVEK